MAGSHFGAAGLVNTRRPARENQGERVELANSLGRNVMTDDPGKRMPLAHAASDELHILGTKIEHQYRSRGRVGIRHESLSAKSANLPFISQDTYRFVHQILSNPRRAAQSTNAVRKVTFRRN